MGRWGGLPGCLKVAQGLLEAALKMLGHRRGLGGKRTTPFCTVQGTLVPSWVRGLSQTETQKTFHIEPQHQGELDAETSLESRAPAARTDSRLTCPIYQVPARKLRASGLVLPGLASPCLKNEKLYLLGLGQEMKISQTTWLPEHSRCFPKSNIVNPGGQSSSLSTRFLVVTCITQQINVLVYDYKL